LKYSRIADASIFSCPVITFITSGHGRDEPIARPALKNNGSNQSLFSVFNSIISYNIITLVLLQPLCSGIYHNCEAASADLAHRIGRPLDTRNGGIEIE
jgi:hypothetical protein